MRAIESNVEAILVGIPMILMLLISFFRVDEVLGQPAKPVQRRRGFTHRDHAGAVVYVEPDGRRHCEPLARTKNDPARIRKVETGGRLGLS